MSSSSSRSSSSSMSSSSMTSSSTSSAAPGPADPLVPWSCCGGCARAVTTVASSRRRRFFFWPRPLDAGGSPPFVVVGAPRLRLVAVSRPTSAPAGRSAKRSRRAVATSFSTVASFMRDTASSAHLIVAQSPSTLVTAPSTQPRSGQCRWTLSPTTIFGIASSSISTSASPSAADVRSPSAPTIEFSSSGGPPPPAEAAAPAPVDDDDARRPASSAGAVVAREGSSGRARWDTLNGPAPSLRSPAAGGPDAADSGGGGGPVVFGGGFSPGTRP
mmetsp:Transcript_5253/g.21666  ORF Transcript_5253/g.21666 Transcript_5253/m.21666 type:complete len:273 (+) Transcript_5253:637-1455(+)